MLQLADAQQALKDRIHEAGMRSANAQRLMDLAVAQPTFSAANAAEFLGIQTPSAHKLIDNLLRIDVLEPFDDRSYKRRFQAPLVLDILLEDIN